MEHPQVSFSTGMGLTIFFTLFLGSAMIFNIILGIKSILKSSTVLLTVGAVSVLLLMIYYFLLYWTTIKVADHQTMELNTKTIFDTQTIRYENITRLQLDYRGKKGYVLVIHQAGKDAPTLQRGFSNKNARKMANFFYQTKLPFETQLFQKK